MPLSMTLSDLKRGMRWAKFSGESQYGDALFFSFSLGAFAFADSGVGPWNKTQHIIGHARKSNFRSLAHHTVGWHYPQ